MHYSEIIIAKLAKLGWSKETDSRFASPNSVSKEFVISSDLVGMIGVPTRIVTISVCDRGRYFSLYNGGDIVFDIDGREYIGNEDMAADVLDDKAFSLFNSHHVSRG